jgi:hypothetical protein
MNPFNCPLCRKEIHWKDEKFQSWGMASSCPHCHERILIVRSTPRNLMLELLAKPHVIYKEPKKRRVRSTRKI